ncbi:transmembrane protein 187-like [Sinocyclocheilus rhinocerous]|uniref:transmembrane protein 187-like n=1 Tax=Sinocyclocheilus rhinocerous TaxID=307959 RepID=UPI0007BA80F0|nr:PREDICTED: transmembrane protein 187-like [Sinocyclocheilus rhinocerous]
MAMSALVHVLIPFLLCIALANTHIFDNVLVDVTYDHYAEKKVDNLPAFLAMPFNCLINLGYILLGIYWILQPMSDNRDTCAAVYTKDVFALMAVAYGPVQWVRLATLRRAPSVLDQWFTLPIFAWVLVWYHVVDKGWSSRYALMVESCSVLSYGLALFHDRGFEVALGCHIAFAVFKGVRAQMSLGDTASMRYLCLALLSCAGFVVLKLLDHSLADYWVFQNLTGHFWSKVCDILQFHYSFCFLTRLSENAHKRSS